MTDDQKYQSLLKELGELLDSKNKLIQVQQWQIESLESNLKKAESEINSLKGENNEQQ